jgi:hypothetical protein
MSGFEWAIIVLFIILIIVGIAIIVALSNVSNELNKTGCQKLSPIFPAQPPPSTFSPPTPDPQSDTFITGGPAAGQNPQVFITTSTDTSTELDGEIGSTCSTDADCRSQNCSSNFCQGHNLITGQDMAFCRIDGSGPNCGDRFKCIASQCKPIGGDLFDLCQKNSDCKPFFICSTGLGSDNEESLCIFKDDPNSCVDGTCSGGYQCSGSQCQGVQGAPCMLDDQCINSCSTQSITKWVDGAWSTYADLPPEIKFNKMTAVTRAGNDDIWGLDLNRGLYYWKHDNPAQSWIQMVDSKFKRRIEYDGDKEEKRLRIIDMAVTDQNTVYLVYKAISEDRRCEDCYAPIYPIYRLNMLSAMESGTSMRERLIPFNTSSGVQWVENSGSTFSKIISIDAILHNGQLIMMIYGSDRPDDNNFTFSLVGSESAFQYSGPKTGDGFNDNNLIKFVSAPDLTAEKQSRLYNYVESATDSLETGPNRIAINGRYPGTKEYGDQTIPRIRSNFRIHDYASIREMLTGEEKEVIKTYLIASNVRNRTTNLYMSPDSAIGIMYTLPGYVGMESLVTVTNKALYLYSPGTCN